MEQISITARFIVNDGKVNEFKNIAKQCIAVVNDKELGKSCSRYDWYFSADGKECHVLESYTNSNSVLAHMGNVGEMLGQLLQISGLTLDLYGNPSEDLQKAASGLSINLYSHFNGK